MVVMVYPGEASSPLSELLAVAVPRNDTGEQGRTHGGGARAPLGT